MMLNKLKYITRIRCDVKYIGKCILNTISNSSGGKRVKQKQKKHDSTVGVKRGLRVSRKKK